ncbi:MAG: YggT family protein [Pseudomonadota bacterium]
MTSFLMIFGLFVDIVLFIIIAQAIMSWLVAFNVLNISQPFVRQIYMALGQLTEPLYRPVRRFLPSTGGIDLAPLIIIFGLFAIETVLRNNFGQTAF